MKKFEKLLADELDIEIRELHLKVVDPHLIEIGADFSQQGLDVFPEIVNTILETPEFKGRMVFIDNDEFAEEISEKHPELEDYVWNEDSFWIYVNSPLSEGKPLKEEEQGLDNKIWDFRHLIKNFDPLDIKVGDTVITPTEGENIIDKIVKYGWDFNYGDIINFQFGNKSLSNKDLIQRNNRRK